MTLFLVAAEQLQMQAQKQEEEDDDEEEDEFIFFGIFSGFFDWLFK